MPGREQQRLRPRRVVGIAHRRPGIAAELGRVARRVRHPRPEAADRARDCRPVDRVADRLPHPPVGERPRAAAPRCVHGKIAEPQGIAAQHLQRRRLRDRRRLGGAEIPDPVRAVGQQVGELLQRLRHLADDDAADRGAPLRPVRKIALEPFEHQHARRRGDREAIRAGADRRLRETLGPQALARRRAEESAPPSRDIRAPPGNGSRSLHPHMRRRPARRHRRATCRARAPRAAR